MEIKDLIRWWVAFLMCILVICICFSSCMTVRTSVGSFKESKGNRYTYSKSKQVWIAWGLIPVGRTNTSTPVNGQCEIIVRQNIIDSGLSAITGGFIKSKTIKVIAKK